MPIATTDPPNLELTRNRQTTKNLVATACAICCIAAVLYFPDSLPLAARFTLAVFFGAIFLWVFSGLQDTYVALAAASVVVIAGVIEPEDFFAPLGDDTIWLLIGAFIISAAITNVGLAPRVTAWLCLGVRSPRLLVHLITLALVCTAFMVPATSGRAALVLPVFLALIPVLETNHRWLLITLSLLMPSVVLLSAVASFIGAGAHLITNQILIEQGFDSFNFSTWMLYGLPYALIASHMSAEVILWLTSSKLQRATQLNITADDFPPAEPFSSSETKCLIILIITVGLWFSEGIHGIPPALVAVICALLITSKSVGGLNLNQAIKQIPWSLLLFMTATVALSTALSASGAAKLLADRAFSVLPEGRLAGWVFVLVVIVVSTAAHLLIQSRSARSAVLIPVVVSLALPLGVNPVAVAFVSTAAAGFCHTLPSSAKPLAIFYCEDGTRPSFTNTQLIQISAALFPLHVVLLVLFAAVIWPLLGLNLFV